MSWSKNNVAHRTLWQLIKFFKDEGDASFETCGAWTNQYCIGGVHNDSQPMIRDKAEALSTKLDEYITKIFGAKYELGKDKNTAITAMTNAFQITSNTLADTADIVDSHYLFHGE